MANNVDAINPPDNFAIGDKVIYVGKTYSFPGTICGFADGQAVVKAIGTTEGYYRGMKHIFGVDQLQPWDGYTKPPALPKEIARTAEEAIAALRFLAVNDRPSGGEETYNMMHLEDIAARLDNLFRMMRYHLQSMGADAPKDDPRATMTEAKIEVRKLDFSWNFEKGAFTADTEFGQYKIRRHFYSDKYILYLDREFIANSSQDVTQVASLAQGDYQSRLARDLMKKVGPSTGKPPQRFA